MGFHRPLPTPIRGVSTLPPLNRPEGYAAAQLNMRSDEKEKLTRRPSINMLRNLSADGLGGGSAYKWHEYYRNGRHHLIAVTPLGTAYMWIDSQFIGMQTLPNDPVSDLNNLKLDTVYDTTYVINTAEVVTTSSVTEVDSWRKRVHINVLSALNYAETVELTVYMSELQVGVVTYTVPGLDGSNQDVADEARATNTVAAALATDLNMLANITAEAKGSNIGMKSATGAIRVEISSGRGDGTINIFNNTVVTPEGITKYALVGTYIRVRPNPITRAGTFYLKAVAQNEAEELATNMVEVVWAESQDPQDLLSINVTTLPVVLEVVNPNDPVPTLDSYVFPAESRQTGDDYSNKGPNWIGSTITAAGLFQDRLLFLTDNKVSLSRTDELGQFYLNSVTELLVTDALDIGSSANSSKLRHAVFHNKDMLIFADNAQFKLDGQTPMTATGGAMPQTTANEVDNNVAPVQMGNSVMFATSYGRSAGVREYMAEANTNADVSASITEQVIGYLQGNILDMSANPNQLMLVIRTDGTPKNEFFVFEGQTLDTANGPRVIPSWSTWSVPAQFEILHVSVGLQRVNLVMLDTDTDEVVLQDISLHSIENTENDIHLDNKVKAVSADGLTVTLPVGYEVKSDTIAVLGDGSKYPLQWMKYTYDVPSRVLTFDIDVGVNAEVFVGIPFKSSYTPTRPFARNRDGSARDTDRMFIGHYVLLLSESYEVTRRIHAEWYNIPDSKFSYRIAGELITHIDEVKPFTGEHRFDVSMDAAQCEVEFFTEGYLPLNISGISYRGQQTSTISRG